MTLLAPVQGQTISSDPFARRDNAKQAQTRNPLAGPQLDRAMAMRGELGLTTDYSFRVVNTHTDDIGWVHVRLREYFQGVRVIRGMLISHRDPQGIYDTYTDALKRYIDVGLRPALAAQQAVTLLIPPGGTVPTYVWPPKTELVIYPVEQRVDAVTRLPISTDERVLLDPDAIPDDINAEDTIRIVKQYHLAYEIRTIQGSEHGGGNGNAWIHYVDANSGQILERHPLAGSGTGHGKFSGTVDLDTYDTGSGHTMQDWYRSYIVQDDDHGSSDPENLDANDIWGDGLAFAGDATASATNRQTAMVDGMFGSKVYWDLMDYVFHRKGPDNNFYSVNVYVHYGTNWDDAEYSYWSGNIHLGDGKSRQALDCLGHENGHALNDFTIDFDGGEGAGLNESNSDIWGAMSTFYLAGPWPTGFSGASDHIPTAGGSWQSVCSGRNMQRPSMGSTVQADYWYHNIGDADEHDAAAPNNHAFYFLSQGASPFMSAVDHSVVLPWGMKGIGTDKAARIWYHALVSYMTDDDDYLAARSACIKYATHRYGSASSEVAAVENAYAGIKVGKKAATYPASPTPVMEHENNNAWQSANFVPHVKTASSTVPTKATAKGGGTDVDWFRVTLAPGEKMTVRLKSVYPANYDLAIYDSFLSLFATSTKGVHKYDMVSLTGASGFLGTPQDYYIAIIPVATTSSSTYVLDFDFSE